MVKMYFEETYLGDSYLNVNNQDTLSISLGRDKGVVVSRNKMTDFRENNLWEIIKWIVEGMKLRLEIRNVRQLI